MRESVWTTLLWGTLSLLCYLVGMVLFLVVAVGAFLAPPKNSLATLTTGDFALVLVSAALLGLGSFLGWKAGGIQSIVTEYPWMGQDRQSKHAQLDKHGSRMPAERSNEEPQPPSLGTDEGGFRCAECGASNDPSFTYCKNCSSELPD